VPNKKRSISGVRVWLINAYAAILAGFV